MKRTVVTMIFVLSAGVVSAESRAVDEFGAADTADTAFWRTASHTLTVETAVTAAKPAVLAVAADVPSSGASLDTRPYSFFSSLASSLNALTGFLMFFR